MVVFNTTHFMDKSRFEVRVVVVGWGALVDKLREHGHTVDTFAFEKSYNRDFIKFIRGLIRKHDIDIVQTHLGRMNSYGFVASLGTPAKNVMTVHGTSEFSNFLGKVYYSLFGNFSGKIVTVSHDLAERFRAGTLVSRSKITAIPNGIDIDRFGKPVNRKEILARFDIPVDAKIILAVGNIREIKGYELLIEAFACIAGTDQRMTVLICGGDYVGYKKRLDVLIAKHGLAERIRFSGFVPDIENLYAVADLYALTSITEGFSLTTVEAMASSMAVVSTDCVGPREIIDDGVDGVIVPDRDPDRFGQMALNLLHDDETRRRLGMAARRKVQDKYSVQTAVNSFERLFKSLVSQ